MRCDDCGCDIPAGQEIETTRSKQTGGVDHMGPRTRTELITICPRCSRRRNFLGWMAGLAVALLFFGGCAVFISELVRRR